GGALGGGRGVVRPGGGGGGGLPAERVRAAMFDNVQLLCLAGAAVIDTVLFLALLERRNRRHVSVPVLLLAAGAWLWHGGAFLVLLLNDLTGEPAARAHQAGLAVMALGLLLMPSAML